jgi:hypothetical protein
VVQVVVQEQEQVVVQVQVVQVQVLLLVPAGAWVPCFKKCEGRHLQYLVKEPLLQPHGNVLHAHFATWMVLMHVRYAVLALVQALVQVLMLAAS